MTIEQQSKLLKELFELMKMPTRINLIMIVNKHFVSSEKCKQYKSFLLESIDMMRDQSAANTVAMVIGYVITDFDLYLD